MELHVTVGVLMEIFEVYRRNVETFAETNYKDVELNNNNLLKYACCDEGHSVLHFFYLFKVCGSVHLQSLE
jgi:hypothetical protein